MPTKDLHHVDTGWAWLILVSSCITIFLHEATWKALAVLLPTFKEQFETHTWVIGTMVTLFVSFRELTGPIVGILATKINNRLLGIVGGTLIGLSTISASFATSVYELLGLLSLINGISFGLLWIPSLALLAVYFDKYYSLAVGIAYAHSSFGMMVIAPVTQFLLDTYGWRGVLLLLGGINFHLLISGILLRQPNYESTANTKNDNLQNAYSALCQNEDDENDTFGWQSHPSKSSRFEYILVFIKLLGLDLFANPSFLVCSVITSCSACVFAGWIVYFIPHCLVKGLSPYEASFAATAAGFSNLIGHIIYAPFLSRNIITVRSGLYITGTVSTIALLVDRYTSTLTTIIISNMFITAATGALSSLCEVYLKSVVEPNSLAKAMGWRMGLSGVLRIIPGFTVGWLYDQTGSYDTGFTFLGAIQAVGILAVAVDHLRLNMSNRKTE
ncbi:monocarboxylate transporter 12-like [Amphiura filiformis]|uniref:monocarboxylate transporter 12-like n=1 Tax=Amphiura filiformis TaxID=82378 RepID=UPI003B2252BE